MYGKEGADFWGPGDLPWWGLHLSRYLQQVFNNSIIYGVFLYQIIPHIMTLVVLLAALVSACRLILILHIITVYSLCLRGEKTGQVKLDCLRM